MNSDTIHINEKSTLELVKSCTNLPQNGLQKYTIQSENNHTSKKKVFLIKSLRLGPDNQTKFIPEILS